MEPTSTPRLKLALGKYRVAKIEKDPLGPGLIFKLELPNSVYMTVNVPAMVDVREGDLLTIYTEVLTHQVDQNGLQ